MADNIEDQVPVAAPPAAPAKVAFVAKPDKAVHDAEIAKLHDEKKTCQDRMTAIRAELDAIQSGRSGFSEKIQQAKAVYLELKEKKEGLYTNKTQLKVNLDKAMAAKSAHRESQKSIRDQVSYKSVEEIEKRISDLQHEQNTKSMSLMAEKNLIKEIESLQQSKKVLAKAAASKDDGAKFDTSIDDIRAAMKAKSEEITAITEQFNAQKAVLDKLRDESNAGGRDEYPKLIEERKTLKTKVDEIFGAIKALRDQFKADNDKYYEGIRAKREAQKAAREAEELKVKADFDAKMAEYEQELAKIHPYQDEQDLCQALVVYLEKTFGKDLAKSASAAGAAAAASVSVELDGLKPFKRDDEDFFVGKKKGGKKAAATPAAKKDVKLVLPLAQLQSFATIGLTPPALVSALEESISAIKAKKEWFAQQTERPAAAAAATTPKATAAPASPKKTAAAKKSSGKFNADDQGAFPSLGGAAPVNGANAAWGPSLSAAAAPVAAVEDDDEQVNAEDDA
ncbi:Aste57867_8569 [Aphanomyces stellatus]|uniref:Aste57867_8569 protein n=1 Tax=Aphanomyces stellatus TaxID=120398 RepID=A0A485KKT9_9STRA|nr:hypothetical protein As57867_008537 [Aphanomyces stellatus]VFT85455.1 Aste57867_8569 [Aphanomyces stellatus]